MEAWEKMSLYLETDMSLSVHIDYKNKDFLILSKGPAQRLDDTTLTVEANYSINLTQPRKGFVLRLHYNGSNSFLFVHATRIYQFKEKDSEIKNYALCLGKISKNFTINNMKKKKKTGLKGIVYFFLLILIILIITIF